MEKYMGEQIKKKYKKNKQKKNIWINILRDI